MASIIGRRGLSRHYLGNWNESHHQIKAVGMTTPTNLGRRESGTSFLHMCLERREVLCSVTSKENASNTYGAQRTLYEWCDEQKAKRHFLQRKPSHQAHICTEFHEPSNIYIAILGGNYYSSLGAI